RHQGQAPDVDGVVMINDFGDRETLKAGEMVTVEVTEVLDFDLVAKVID
ncbi:MAG: hypothetical protein ACPGJV_05720, partial [Bacteriovoracaceae bacterium]